MKLYTDRWIVRQIPVTSDFIMARRRRKGAVTECTEDRAALDKQLENVRRTENGLSDALERKQVIGISLHLQRLDQEWNSIQNLVVKQTESVSPSLPTALSGVC